MAPPLSMNPVEREVIERALRGDDEAFESVIRQLSRRVFALAYGILQDTSEAEDVTQEAFLQAHRHRWRLRDPAKFPAWLFAVTRHRALDVLRRRRHGPITGPSSEEDEVIDPTMPRPGAALETAERHEDLRRALATLPERHRIALTLRYLEGLDPAAIEQTMGLSNGALRGVLGRALAALRKTLHPATP